METLYDVQQILKRFGIYVYLGKRLYDIELMEIEIKNLHEAHLIDEDEYKTARLILRREHRVELTRKDEKRFI